MALLCPVLSTTEDKARYQELVNKAGSDTAAYRMYYRYAHTKDPIGEALRKFDINAYKVEDKIKSLQAVSSKIKKIEGFDPNTGEPIHEYETADGKKLISVSRALDDNPITRYRGQAAGSHYSDKGSVIHKLFELYIKLDNREGSIANIKQFMSENSMPESLLDAVQKTVAYLRTKGKILPELMLADLDSGIAGTGDIVLLGYDGKVYLYDIKTAHLTPEAAKRGVTKVWDPIHHFDGYKAKRYPTQLEFYSRMIERTLGQPVSEAYIIPIEVFYNDNDPSKGFKELKLLPVENKNSYGSNTLADEIVSEFFHENRLVRELPKLATIDDSGELMRAITGKLEGKFQDLDKEADEILNNPQYHKFIKGSKYYWNPLQKKNVFLKDQSNKAMQRRQIIDEYLSKLNTGRDNIDESVRNYLITGRDEFLDSLSKETKDMLRIYKGRRDITVDKLSAIKGFEDKKGWILIEDSDVNKGGTYDLIYLGNDDLDETLNIGRKLKKGNTLFAKYFTSHKAAYLLGSSLQNTVADAKKFEAALIALKMKESIPNASFRRILIHSTHPGNFPVHYADLHKLLPIAQKFGKLKPNLIPTNLKSAFQKDDLFNPRTYQQNALEAYKAFILAHGNSRERRSFKIEDFAEYEKDKNNLEQLAYAALAEARNIEKQGLASDPIHLEEMRLLRNIYYNINQIGQEIYPIGYKGGFVSMPQNLAPDVIQDIVQKMSDALYRIRENFWDGYKKPTGKYFRNLFGSTLSLDNARDLILSDTDRYYEPLLTKVKKKVIVGTDESGNSIIAEQEVYDYNLVSEEGEAFKTLSKEQQEFIKMFNDRVQEAMKIMGIEWERGKLPLVPASYRNKLYRAYKLGINSTLGHYQEAITQMFQEFENSFTDTTKAEDEYTVGASNIFRTQQNGPGYDNRSKLIGIVDDFVHPEENGRWETNLEIVLDLTMMTAYRSSEMQRMNDIVLAAKNHFDWQKSNLFEERLGANINWTRDYRIGNIENRDVDSGKWYNKVVRTANKVASFSLIGFSPAVAVASTVGQQVVAGSQAISNSLSNNGKYTISNWNKAFLTVLNPGNWTKVNLLLEQYKMYNQDMSSYMNGYHRYGDKSIFRMKWAYGFLNAGDWLSRSQVLVAYLLQDGLWNAYSVENGQLKYDEDKDPRDPLLKKTIKANLQKENPSFVVNDKMQRAYDFNITRSIKAQIDMVVGGYDRETRGMYNFYALGKLLMLFKTYMPSRIDRLTAAPFTSRMIGKYELVEENGKKEYIWKGDQLEGLFHSLNMGMLYLQNLNTDTPVELTPHQRENLARLAGDFLMYGMAAMITWAVVDDDDENKIDDFTAYALQGALRDLLAFYNVLGYAEFMMTPVALGFIERSAKRVYNILMNAADPETDTLLSTLSLHSAFNDYQEIMNFLYDEPSN
jgi:hypothetical protein